MRKGRGIVNYLIDKFPFEAHIPGDYRYCGPGTRLSERLARGDPPKDQLDRACQRHDISYSKSSDTTERSKADKILLEEAWKRVKAPDSSLRERAAALLTAGAMKAKLMTGSGMRRKRKTKKRGRVIAVPRRGGKLRSMEVGRKRGAGVRRKKTCKKGGAMYLRQYKKN